MNAPVFSYIQNNAKSDAVRYLYIRIKTVHQGEIIQLELKDNGEQVDVDGNKDMSAVSRQIHLENFDAEAAPAKEVNNTDPNNAALIDVNTIISGSITEAGQQRWYFFGANAGKLTLNLDFTNSQNVGYDIYLYLYDDASSTITFKDIMRKIKSALDKGIEVIVIRAGGASFADELNTMSRKNNNLRLYMGNGFHIQKDAESENFGMDEVSAPIILVIGAGERCCQFDIQLELRNTLLENGYAVLPDYVIFASLYIDSLKE